MFRICVTSLTVGLLGIVFYPVACDEQGAPFSGASPSAPQAQNSTLPAANGQSDPGKLRCPHFRNGVSVGKVAAPELTETSGLVSSRSNAGVLWAHNDSGDSARLFALSAQGGHLATFVLPTVSAVDWEDIAIGAAPGGARPHLYIGDIGDNSSSRTDGVVIHRAPEPEVPKNAQAAVQRPLAGLESFRVLYPDGPHDAETLLVDPKTGEVVIVTKSFFSAPRIFYATKLHAPATTLSGGEHLDLKAAGIDGLYATGGDVSSDGRWVLVRGYGAAFLWQRDPARPLHEAFAGRACEVPIADEPQGESIAFAVDGSGYFTLSEKKAQPLYFYARE